MGSLADALRSLLERSHQLNPRDVPRVAREEAARAGLHDAEIMLVDREQRALLPFDDRSGGDSELAVEGTLAGESFRNTEPRVERADDDRSTIWVPLLDGTDRLGVFGVTVRSAGVDTATRDAMTFAALVAELVVTKHAYTDVIELARRTTEMDIGAEMRWSMLPPLQFAAPGVSIAGILEPAYDVAGDTFDYALNDTRMHVAMFDAVGHGLPSARLANLAVGGYRHARRAGRSLVEACRVIDDVLIDQFSESWFVTGVLGVLDVATGGFEWVVAGHPPPLRLRPNGAIEMLECAPALPFGLGGQPPVPSQVQLDPGDRVFFYSDGITESRTSGGEFFGEERTMEWLARYALSEPSAAEALRRFTAALLDHLDGGGLRDDATVLLLCWDGPPAS